MDRPFEWFEEFVEDSMQQGEALLNNKRDFFRECVEKVRDLHIAELKAGSGPKDMNAYCPRILDSQWGFKVVWTRVSRRVVDAKRGKETLSRYVKMNKVEPRYTAASFPKMKEWERALFEKYEPFYAAVRRIMQALANEKHAQWIVVDFCDRYLHTPEVRGRIGDVDPI